MLDEKNEYNKNRLSQYIIPLKLNYDMNMKFQGDPYPQEEEFISHDQDFSNQFVRDIVDEEFGKGSIYIHGAKGSHIQSYKKKIRTFCTWPKYFMNSPARELMVNTFGLGSYALIC